MTITVFEMTYVHPTKERSSVELLPYSSRYHTEYRRIYNECFHEMREALGIEPYDFIQDDSFFATGMDQVYLLTNEDNLLGGVRLKGNEIDDLIVNPDYQGMGYGKQILLWVLEHIRADRIVLHVAEWNKKAISLYQKTGFEITDTFAVKVSDSETNSKKKEE